MKLHQPLDMQPIGQDLAIKWEDGGESFVGLETLRRACPCAGCKGEVDVMGQIHRGPDKPLGPSSFVLLKILPVGGYAAQLFWADGHSSGLYPFAYLRKLAGES